jgi:predicted outer membrane repeat protein
MRQPQTEREASQDTHNHKISERMTRLCMSITLGVLLSLAAWWMLAASLSPAHAAPMQQGGSGFVRVALTGTNSAGCGSVATPCATVQFAVDQAQTNDQILVASGTYTGVSVRDGVTQVVYISQSLTLRGGYTVTNGFAASDPVANPTILDAQDGGRVVYITNTHGALENLMVKNGSINSGNVNSDVGGGLYASQDLTLTNVSVLSNTAFSNGGGAYVSGTVTLSGGLFQDNRSTNNRGGGLYALGKLSLTGTQFLSNTAREGGGVHVGGAATLNGGLFQNNRGTLGNGGGLYVIGNLNLTGTQFLNNTARNTGGGAYVGFGAAILNGGLFQNNSSTHSTLGGGGGLIANTLSLTGTQFLSNTANSGSGGAWASGVAMLNGGVFQGNSGKDGGGLLAGDTVNLTGTQFLNNTASNEGGGLLAGSAMTLTAISFIRNTAARGGGLFHSSGNGLVVNTLFAENIATLSGTALYLGSPSGAQLQHLTIGSPVTVTGSAVYIQQGNVSLTNTIIAQHEIALQNESGNVTQNFNLFYAVVTPTQGTILGGANNVVGNPNFVNPSQDDYHLRIGSAAADAGTDVRVMTDADGDSRPRGSGFDIGYDEAAPTQRVYLPLVIR